MNTNKEISIVELRNTLKGVMKKELESLPETLKKLEPEQRLNIVCKLIPFVFPKVESVFYKKDESTNEPFSFFE